MRFETIVAVPSAGLSTDSSRSGPAPPASLASTSISPEAPSPTVATSALATGMA